MSALLKLLTALPSEETIGSDFILNDVLIITECPVNS